MVAETELGAELTTAEAAALAGVSDRTIRNWIKDGHLPAHKVDDARRVRKDDLLAYLKARSRAVAGVLGQDALTETPAEAVTETVARETPAETTPEALPNGHTAAPVITPELLNVVLQPLREELETERRERRRLHDENLELAGRVGFYQAKVQEYEGRLLLLEAPKEQAGEASPLTQPPVAAPADELGERPWWRRIFRSA